MLDELEVVEAVGDNGRLGAKVYRIVGGTEFPATSRRLDAQPLRVCVRVVLSAFMGSAWVIDDRPVPYVQLGSRTLLPASSQLFAGCHWALPVAFEKRTGPSSGRWDNRCCYLFLR